MWENTSHNNHITHGFTVLWLLTWVTFSPSSGSPLDFTFLWNCSFCKIFKLWDVKLTQISPPLFFLTETKYYKILSGFASLQPTHIFLTWFFFLAFLQPSLLRLSPRYSLYPVSSVPLPLFLLLHLLWYFTTLGYLWLSLFLMPNFQTNVEKMEWPFLMKALKMMISNFSSFSPSP